MVVPKKDESGNLNKHRICIDPRPLNSMLPDDTFPIPTIEEVIEILGNSSIFSKLDLVNSYHQFKINESDRSKTTFTANGKQYEFVGAPFGIKTLTSTFQRVMNSLFSEFPFVHVYVDDVLVFSESLDDHVNHH